MRGVWISIFIGIIIFATNLLDSYKYMDSLYNKIGYEVQRENINYAADAALKTMINNTSNLNLDYKDFGNVDINVSEGIKNFKNVIAMSKSKYLSEDVLAEVDDSIIGIIIFAFDGYYIVQRENAYEDITLDVDSYISNNLADKIITKKLTISPKIPYTYEFNSGDGKVYVMNLGKHDMIEVNPDTLDYRIVDKSATFASEGKSVNNELATKLSNIVNEAIKVITFNYYGGENIKDIRIPAGKNVDDIVTINGLSIIAVMNTSWNKSLTQYISIGGTQVKIADFFITYTRNGEKFYSNAFNISKLSKQDNVVLQSYFTSRADCARFGYKYDLSLEE